jgi:hypothetical protein
MTDILVGMIRACVVVLVIGLGVVGCDDKSAKQGPLKPAPTVSSVIPEVVTPKGYRLGQIRGEGFDTKAPVKVFFGNSPAQRAAVVAKNLITVEMPPGTHDTSVDVRVEIQGYEPATAPMKLRYDEQDHGEAARKQLEEAKEAAEGSGDDHSGHDHAEGAHDGSAEAK